MLFSVEWACRFGQRPSALVQSESIERGPARVARLRNRATKQGLDPNIWFDNVEVIAAKQIGREPVQYVSNIYKYWIAYRLSREHLDGVADLTASM